MRIPALLLPSVFDLLLLCNTESDGSSVEVHDKDACAADIMRPNDSEAPGDVNRRVGLGMLSQVHAGVSHTRKGLHSIQGKPLVAQGETETRPSMCIRKYIGVSLKFPRNYVWAGLGTPWEPREVCRCWGGVTSCPPVLPVMLGRVGT